MRFEILLYDTVFHQPISKQTSPAEFAHVGSIDTLGVLVEHILEFFDNFLLVVGKANTFIIY